MKIFCQNQTNFSVATQFFPKGGILTLLETLHQMFYTLSLLRRITTINGRVVFDFCNVFLFFPHKSKSFEDFGSDDEKIWGWVEAETFVFYFLCFLLVSRHFGLCCDFVSTPKNKWWMKAKECLLFNLSERFYQNDRIYREKQTMLLIFSLCMLL